MKKFVYLYFLAALLLVLGSCDEYAESPAQLELNTVPILLQHTEFADMDMDAMLEDLAAAVIGSLRERPPVYDEQERIANNFYHTTQDPSALSLFNYLRAGNDEAAARIIQNEFLARFNNIQTAIIDDGIAYIALEHLPNSWPQIGMSFYEPLIAFYNEIMDFDHLIIDLRGTRGTYHFESMWFIVGPHMREGQAAPIITYAFFAEAETGRGQSGPAPVGDSVIISTQDMLERFDVPYLSMDNIEGLHYAVRGNFTYRPSPHFLYEDYHFAGQMWILIDQNMDFGPQSVALIASKDGFANVVGESIYLDFKNNPRFADIDGGFYVTDKYGRTLEYLVPNFHNRPGMDALKTALALIADHSN